ncbi:elongation factor 3, putative [Babesia ovata]|uniref:Elongation factor 3, putative n=1 Tax=Babesia ovata TaxID=189622 RepID=A0A2H6KGW1_9APIC|nr:elongation factor 3, putative [Babesia ovata]GBE62224.1 elongation factor 3, putative [Babesia ovata]
MYGTIIFAALLCTPAACDIDSIIDGKNAATPLRQLSGVSRRKYLQNDMARLMATPSHISLMDSDADDEDEDDDDGDYHHFEVDGAGATTHTRIADVKASEKVNSKDSVKQQHKPLLMGSLPATTENTDAPGCALDVIGDFFNKLSEKFHNSMNEFFDNIDKQIKANSELPLLEQGDTFF